jgi:TolB protein
MTTWLAAAAVLLVGFTAAACSGGGGPDAGLPGRIVFISDESGDHEVWVMNADGSGKEQLTRMPPDNASPAWSPDGKKITFVSAAGDEGGMATFVMDSDGDNVRQLLGPALQWYGKPRLLADGRTLHFNRGETVMLLDSEGEERGPAGILGSSPAAAPDGNLWAYEKSTLGRRDRVSSEVRVSEPNSDTWTLLSEDWDLAMAPDWSPDGRRIAMSCAREYDISRPSIPIAYLISPRPSDPVGICVVNADGTGLEKIVEEGGNPTWSPDGEWIAYERGEIYVVRPDGSDVRAITNCGCQASQPDWGR